MANKISAFNFIAIKARNFNGILETFIFRFDDDPKTFSALHDVIGNFCSDRELPVFDIDIAIKLASRLDEMAGQEMPIGIIFTDYPDDPDDDDDDPDDEGDDDDDEGDGGGYDEDEEDEDKDDWETGDDDWR